MIDPKEKLHQELVDYVMMEENLDKKDRIAILKAIVEKAFIFEKSLHFINHSDILLISSISKDAYGNLSLPLYIGEKRVEYDDLRTIAHMEAFISYMNLNYLSRKEVQINYKRK